MRIFRRSCIPPGRRLASMKDPVLRTQEIAIAHLCAACIASWLQPNRASQGATRGPKQTLTLRRWLSRSVHMCALWALREASGEDQKYVLQGLQILCEGRLQDRCLQHEVSGMAGVYLRQYFAQVRGILDRRSIWLYLTPSVLAHLEHMVMLADKMPEA